MLNMNMKETIRKILIRALDKKNIENIEQVKYLINSHNNITMLVPFRGQKGNAKLTIFQSGESVVGQFGKDFREVEIDINNDIQKEIYKVLIDGKCMYKYEDFEEDKALDRIKKQLKDKEYKLLQVM